MNCNHYKKGFCEIEQAYITPNWCKERCRKALPSIPQQAVSFAKAVVNHIKEGRPARTLDEQARIKTICKGCEYYIEKNGSPRCSKCGCFLNIKARWATADCPIGKWEKLKNTSIFMKANGSNADIVDLFKGQSIFLIGNGASFADVDKSVFNERGIMTACMNNGAAKFKPNIWIGEDPPAKFVEHIWTDPSIMKFTRLTNANRRYWSNGKYADYVKTCPNVWYHHLKSEPKPAIWREEDRINWSIPYGESHRPTVFMAALHILYFLGFKNVYLVGTDFKMDKDKPYFFDEKQPQGVVNYNNLLYQAIDNYLKRVNFGSFKITNCTPNSGLTAVNYMPLEDAILQAKIPTSQDTYGMYKIEDLKDEIDSETSEKIYISGGRGDILCAEPAIREYIERENKAIIIGSKFPDIFKYHPNCISEYSASNADYHKIISTVRGANHIVKNGFDKLDMSNLYDFQQPAFYYDEVEISELSSKISFSKPTISIGVMAGKKIRCWNRDNWNKIVKYFIDKGYQCAILGSDKNARLENGTDLVDKLSIFEAAEVIKRSEFLISVESFLPHLAAAMGTKSYVLFGATQPEYYNHYTTIPIYSNLCSMCWPHYTDHECPREVNKYECMLSITPELVIKAIEND